MTVNAVSNTSSAPGPAHGTLGKDDFLKLMMAQLSHQDPTSPVDSTAFTAQLAQFTTLEQMKNQSQSLDSLVMAQAAGNQLAAAGLVGKEATFHSDTVQFDGVTPASVSGTLGGAAAQVTVTITDSAGKKVRTMQLGAMKEGPLTTAWDGRDDDGVPVPKGSFTISLTASDAAGTNVPATNWGKGRIDGISFEHGYAQLILGDRHITLSDVLQINESRVKP